MGFSLPMYSEEDRRHSSPGFPHSDILGSRPACGSPRLIAASHALHRFLAPRHPPFALSSLTTNFFAYFWRTLLGYTRESTYSVVKELRGQSRDSLDRLSAPGGDDRSRTGDPLLAKQVLSQLSYIPAHLELVGLPGIEPGTSRLSSARSSHLS